LCVLPVAACLQSLFKCRRCPLSLLRILEFRLNPDLAKPVFLSAAYMPHPSRKTEWARLPTAGLSGLPSQHRGLQKSCSWVAPAGAPRTQLSVRLCNSSHCRIVIASVMPDSFYSISSVRRKPSMSHTPWQYREPLPPSISNTSGSRKTLRNAIHLSLPWQILRSPAHCSVLHPLYDTLRNVSRSRADTAESGGPLEIARISHQYTGIRPSHPCRALPPPTCTSRESPCGQTPKTP